MLTYRLPTAWLTEIYSNVLFLPFFFLTNGALKNSTSCLMERLLTVLTECTFTQMICNSASESFLKSKVWLNTFSPWIASFNRAAFPLFSCKTRSSQIFIGSSVILRDLSPAPHLGVKEPYSSIKNFIAPFSIFCRRSFTFIVLLREA